MARYPGVFAQPRLRRRRAWVGRALVLLAVVAIAPLVVDGTKVCVANWMMMRGQSMSYDTPAFDFVAQVKREATSQVWALVGPAVREPPWKAGTTITFAAGWAVAIAWMFRAKR